MKKSLILEILYLTRDDVLHYGVTVLELALGAAGPVAVVVILVLEDSDIHLRLSFAIVEKCLSDGLVVFVIVVAPFLHFFAFGVEDHFLADI